MNSKHWTEGGTFVTNFQLHRLPIFKEAIKRYGDDKIIACDYSESPAPRDYGGCLHDTRTRSEGASTPCLSAFWKIFKEVEAEEIKNAPEVAKQSNEA